MWYTCCYQKKGSDRGYLRHLCSGFWSLHVIRSFFHSSITDRRVDNSWQYYVVEDHLKHGENIWYFQKDQFWPKFTKFLEVDITSSSGQRFVEEVIGIGEFYKALKNTLK